MIGTTGFRQPDRRTGPETKTAILAVATQEFRDRGYTAATLADVADRLGITRSAVLHHFGTKAEVLREVVRPWATAVAELVARYPTPPLGRARTRTFVADLLDVLLTHRDVVLMLSQDVAATTILAASGGVADPDALLLTVLGGRAGDPASMIRASAVLGAVGNIVLRRPDTVDLLDPVQRKTTLDVVMKLVAPTPAAGRGVA